jgi:hypothetical protein
MDDSSVISILLILVPLSVALVVFGLLRERGVSATRSGCVAASAGVALIGVWVLVSIARIVL